MIADESSERLSKFEPFHLTYRIANRGRGVWRRSNKRQQNYLSEDYID
jgi:hypothetical protein